jgi:chromosome segregation ATPase
MLLSLVHGGDMSEESLARIESKLDGLVEIQSSLTKLEEGQTRLEQGQASLEQRQASLVEGQASLVRGQATLTTGLDEVRIHLVRVDKRLEKLEVGQEEIRDNIKQLAESHAVTRAAIARSTEAVIAHIDKRIDPLEAAVRQHFGTA